MDPQDHDRLVVAEQEIKSIKQRLADMVTKGEFWPIQKIVYAGVGIILLTVLGVLLFNAGISTKAIP